MRFAWVFVLVAVVFVGDRAGGFLFKKLVEQSQFRYSRSYAGQSPSDVLIVANSRGLPYQKNYIEEITDKKICNLSYNGLPVDLAKVLIDDYLEQYDPEVVLLDITICDRLNKELINGFNVYLPYSDNVGELIKGINPKGYYASQLSHLYRYNSELFQRSLFHLRKSDDDWMLDREVPPNMLKKLDGPYEFIIQYPKEHIPLFKDIVEYVKSKGVRIKLLISPYHPGFEKTILNLDDLKGDVEKVTGMEILDYSDKVQDGTMFSDFQHLNRKGSVYYLDMLAKDGVFE